MVAGDATTRSPHPIPTTSDPPSYRQRCRSRRRPSPCSPATRRSARCPPRCTRSCSRLPRSAARRAATHLLYALGAVHRPVTTGRWTWVRPWRVVWATRVAASARAATGRPRPLPRWRRSQRVGPPMRPLICRIQNGLSAAARAAARAVERRASVGEAWLAWGSTALQLEVLAERRPPVVPTAAARRARRRRCECWRWPTSDLTPSASAASYTTATTTSPLCHLVHARHYRLSPLLHLSTSPRVPRPLARDRHPDRICRWPTRARSRQLSRGSEVSSSAPARLVTSTLG